MAKFFGGRPSFREWVNAEVDPTWDPLPLTHVAKALVAQDIIRDGHVKPQRDQTFEEPVAYFFYGRAAYRVSGDGSIKSAAACPFCFVMDPQLATSATTIHAFDTGAFAKRLYSRIIMDEIDLEDFGLGNDYRTANKLISRAFGSRSAYVKGDPSNIASAACNPWDFHAKAYLDLLTSSGRNEPDDRIGTIEFVFRDEVPIAGGVKALIVPHILWDAEQKTPWLTNLEELGVEISTYEFLPSRSPDYYYAQLETQLLILYQRWGLF